MTANLQPAVADADALLAQLVAYFHRYLILGPGCAEALALWTAYTHALNYFEVSPILAFTSPVKRCGKTRALDVLGAVVRSPLAASNVTGPALFHAIEAQQPTLLIDEADTFLTGNRELRGILNSGHTRSSAYVLRAKGKFSTWAPKAIAGLGSLPPTIADRSILVPMHRKARDEAVARVRLGALQREMDPLREQLATWAADPSVAAALIAAAPVPVVALSDRGNDSWAPLLAIADLAGGTWPQLAREAAQQLAAAGAVDGEQDDAVLLLAHIRDLFESEPQHQFLASKRIVAALNDREDAPWSESSPRGLTVHALARRLRAFGIVPRKVRRGASLERGYSRAQFADAWARYG